MRDLDCRHSWNILRHRSGCADDDVGRSSVRGLGCDSARRRTSTPSAATTCRRRSSGRTCASTCQSCSTRSGSTAPSSCSTPWWPAHGRDRPCLLAPDGTVDLRRPARPGQPHRPRPRRRPRPRARATGCCSAARTTRGWSPAGSPSSRPAAWPSPPCRCCAPASWPRSARSARPASPCATTGSPRTSRPRQIPDLTLIDLRRRRHGGDLDARGRRTSRPTFDDVDTAADDVALLAFTSGTHRPPQGHHALPPRRARHRRHLLARTSSGRSADDVFTGTPPLAFTFGLGGLRGLPAAGRRRRRC